MNEANIKATLLNKWPAAHWISVESSTQNGIPDMNMCYNGKETWLELKVLRGQSIFLETFQLQFHIQRNRAGGRSLILAADENRIVVLKIENPRIIYEARTVGKFHVFDTNDSTFLTSVIKWFKPYDWAYMFDELMELL